MSVYVTNNSLQLRRQTIPSTPTISRPVSKELAKELQAMAATDTAALWEVYKQEYQKTYDSNEEVARYGHFQASIHRIISVNNDEQATHWASLNEFSDMSFEEFKAVKLLPSSSLDSMQQPRKRKLSSTSRKLLGKTTKPPATNPPNSYPLKWDWNAQGKVFPVQDQGACNSCWAHAATSVLESWALIKGKLASTDPANKLSVQHLVDCVYPTSGQGCTGGGPYGAFTYIYNNFQTLESAYDLYTSGSTGLVHPCNTAAVDAARTAEATHIHTSVSPGYVQLPTQNATVFFNTLYTMPIDVSFAVVPTFQDYRGGIYSDNTCQQKDINHNMAAVGYDISTGLGSRDSFITVKNSWGTNWGEFGFARIKAYADKTIGACSVYAYNFVPA